MSERIKAIIARLKVELAADKKRAGVLGVLLLVLVVVTVRAFVGGSTPTAAEARPAVAAPAIAAAPDGAGSAETAPRVRPVFESTEPSPVVAAPVSPTSPAAEVAAPAPILVNAKPLKPVEIEPGRKQVTRDLFASAAWSSFPSARRTSSTQPADEESDAGFWSKLAASLADRGVEQRIELQRIDSLAQELRLEATMSGDAPAAYISGRLVHVGDSIRSFSVVSIDDRCVTLAMDGHHIRLRIP